MSIKQEQNVNREEQQTLVYVAVKQEASDEEEQAEGDFHYYDAICLMKFYKKELGKEEARLKTKLETKLANIRMRRKALERRRLLFQTDIETHKVDEELKRRRERRNPQFEWGLDGSEAYNWAEETFKLPQQNVTAFINKIDELLPLDADRETAKKAFWTLDRLGENMLQFTPPPSKEEMYCPSSPQYYPQSP